MKIREGLVFVLLLLLTSCSQPDLPKGMFTKVERVVTGQTLEILDKTGDVPVLQQVRLMGITTPDLKQDPWGTQAQQKLKQLCQGKQILLEGNLNTKDRYGRIAGYIWLNNVLINELLVKEGYALTDTQPNNQSSRSNLNSKYTQRLSYAQEYARLMGYGIWNPEKPMRLTPAEFRSQQKNQ